MASKVFSLPDRPLNHSWQRAKDPRSADASWHMDRVGETFVTAVRVQLRVRAHEIALTRPFFGLRWKRGSRMGKTEPVDECWDEASACYACGAEVTDSAIGINRIQVCSSCGMGSIARGAVAGDYWSRRQFELEESYWGARRSLFRSALKRLAVLGVHGTVVDLGGGVGHFTECALEMGWDAYSADSSELAVDAAANRLGEHRSLGVEDLDRFQGQCDLVTLWCVVAHVPDPSSLLSKAVKLLKPGGRLLLTTPNFLFQEAYARLLARVGRPIDFVAHDHFLHFTPAALDGLLARAGFDSWSYDYLGVTDECVVERGLAWLLVPVKRMWNRLGTGSQRLGLPPLSAELQVIAKTDDRKQVH